MYLLYGHNARLGIVTELWYSEKVVRLHALGTCAPREQK
jgi:hypothetical protein